MLTREQEARIIGHRNANHDQMVIVDDPEEMETNAVYTICVYPLLHLLYSCYPVLHDNVATDGCPGGHDDIFRCLSFSNSFNIKTER